MLSSLFIFLTIINVLPHLTMAGTQNMSCMKDDTAGDRAERIQSIADHILKQLGYNRAPSVPKTMPPKKLMMDYKILKLRAHEECDIIESHAVNVDTIPGRTWSMIAVRNGESGYGFKRGSCI